MLFPNFPPSICSRGKIKSASSRKFLSVSFQVSESSEIQHTEATVETVLWFSSQYQSFIVLGSYAGCCCMYCFSLRSLYLWSFVCTFCHLSCGFVPFTDSLRLCWYFVFSFCVACQMYCILKDVKVYFNFWNKLNIMMSKRNFCLIGESFLIQCSHLNLPSSPPPLPPPPPCWCFKQNATLCYSLAVKWSPSHWCALLNLNLADRR